METRERDYKRIGRVEDLDGYKVADHEADPRGWNVIGSDGSKLGEVDHLIGDTAEKKVIFLTVDVDDALIGEDRKVLIPVERVDLDRDDEKVVVRGMSGERIITMPPYAGDSIDEDYVLLVHRSFDENPARV